MEAVLRRILAVTRWNDVEKVETTIVAHPPARAEALEALADAVPHPLPPSYVRLLRIHDGIEGVFGSDGDVLPSSYRFEYNGEWKPCTEEWDDCPALEDLIFIAMDDDGSALAFDARSEDAAGEMELVEIVNYRELIRYASLGAYLLEYAELREGWLRRR